MGNTIFFLRAFNDIDHIAPLIWRFIEKNETPIVVFHTDYSYENDYRIQFLQKERTLKIYSMPDREYIIYEKSGTSLLSSYKKRIYTLKRNRNNFLGKLCRKNFTCIDEIAFLKKHNVSQCIFEWGTPYERGLIIEKFFLAAKGLGITTFCLPHGCNVLTNVDVTKTYLNLISRGVIPDQSKRGEYDYFVLQNPLRRDGWVKWGLDPLKAHAWGSTRFYPEWQKKNLEICPPFSPKNEPGEKLKVVYMHHQWHYNIKKSVLMDLLRFLASQNWFYLVIKASTRMGLGDLPPDFEREYAESPHVEIVGQNALSPSLIDWSDAVLNYNSSIGIEALLQNKPLINLSFVHTNTTLYEETGACLNAADKEEVLEHLKKIKDDRKYNVPETNKEQLYKEIIYGGREKHDVLESYYQKITAKYLAY